MLDLNAAIQAAKSSDNTSPTLPGGPTCTHIPSKFWPRPPHGAWWHGPGAVLTEALCSFLRDFLGGGGTGLFDTELHVC
jgi:hypothetical protein